VTDENGERVAVIITLAEFEELTELLEDLDDAAVVEQRRGERGIPHSTAMQFVRDNCAIPD
jgi:PHD/YefM family antitoxin component YafN of YafNO toxin-antitoxin module